MDGRASEHGTTEMEMERPWLKGSGFGRDGGLRGEKGLLSLLLILSRRSVPDEELESGSHPERKGNI